MRAWEAREPRPRTLHPRSAESRRAHRGAATERVGKLTPSGAGVAAEDWRATTSASVLFRNMLETRVTAKVANKR
jgi:hypothetical protein